MAAPKKHKSEVSKSPDKKQAAKKTAKSSSKKAQSAGGSKKSVSPKPSGEKPAKSRAIVPVRSREVGIGMPVTKEQYERMKRDAEKPDKSSKKDK